MPLGSANWKVWAVGAATGAACGADAAGATATVTSNRARSALLEPVKPAAAALVGCALGGRRRFGGTAQNAIRETGVGALHILFIGLELGADGWVGVLDPGIGQQHLLAGRIIAGHL